MSESRYDGESRYEEPTRRVYREIVKPVQIVEDVYEKEPEENNNIINPALISREKTKEEKSGLDIGKMRTQIVNELYMEFYTEIKEAVKKEVEQDKSEIVRDVASELKAKLKSDLKRDLLRNSGERE
jgi:hypothetical protein